MSVITHGVSKHHIIRVDNPHAVTEVHHLEIRIVDACPAGQGVVTVENTSAVIIYRHLGIDIIVYLPGEQPHLLVCQLYAVSHHSLAGITVIRQILTPDVNGVSLPDVDVAECKHLVCLIIVPGTVTTHEKIIMLQPDIAVQLVSRTVSQTVILHLVRMEDLNLALGRSVLRIGLPCDQ